jgi:hypothetical protein
MPRDAARKDAVDEFEYISVLLSILIGLGVSQLLGGIARLVRDGRALAPAWWVMVTVATLLIASLQVWWASFTWRHVADWTFLSYVAFMVLPSLLYLLAYLILPSDLHLDGDALAESFIRKRRPFFVMVALVPLASLSQQWLLNEQPPPLDLDAGIRLFWMVLAVPGYLSSRRAVQAALAVTFLAVMLLYIALLFVQLR